MCYSEVVIVVSYKETSTSFCYYAKMTWSEEHDNMLCRKIPVEEPYKCMHGSIERGRCWDRIAEALNKID